MSDIDIQIAQILGYKKFAFRDAVLGGEWWIDKDGKSVDIRFSSSLDLMHELEMMIPEEKQYAYYKYVEREVALGDVLFKKYEDGRYAPSRFLLITATAEQRAQAWKKVMGGE